MSKTRTPGAEPIKWLTVDDLTYDPDIQRPTDEKRAERIAADFDPDKFGVIAVWHTEDDKFVVIDGMHRVTALKAMGWNGQKIPCSVFEGISKQEAAGLFIGRNDGRAVRFIDRFLVRLIEKDPVACDISAIVMDAGYVIDRDHRDGVITAAKALEDVYVGRGLKLPGRNPEAVRDAIYVATEAWGRTTDAANGRVLHAVGSMFLRYGEAIDRDRLAKKLAAVPGPSALLARGQGYRERHGGSVVSNMAHWLTDAYNRGMRGKGRLPGWRDS